MTTETPTQNSIATQLDTNNSNESNEASRTSAPTSAELATPQNLRTPNLSEISTELTGRSTPIHHCVREELREYMDLLNGEIPSDLHRLVMQQVETALFGFVMEECRGNQSKAAAWLGISRGTLRTRLAALNLR